MGKILITESSVEVNLNDEVYVLETKDTDSRVQRCIEKCKRLGQIEAGKLGMPLGSMLKHFTIRSDEELDLLERLETLKRRVFPDQPDKKRRKMA